MEPNIVIVHVLKKYDNEWRCLLLRRCSKFLPGNWQMITGKVQEKETAIKAALRELREESGLTPDRFYSADFVETFFLHTYNMVCFAPVFVAFIDQEQEIILSPQEHDDYKWVSFSDAFSILEFSGQRTALHHIQEEFIAKTPSERFIIEA
ncbi:MAG: NUDIX domain-containing protein [Waddliaceae bacterium]|jgi:dihydroneopterin triphosphate diphosphatase|nr:NUDIX domain-containing protein [Waddliaceae bacterium]